MDKKDQVSGSYRISDAILDVMLAGTDAGTVCHGGELISELQRRLTKRILDAEMEVHLGSRGRARSGQHSQDGADGPQVNAAGSGS